MVERVALALIRADGAEDPNMTDAVFDDYLLRARYAIEAMEEPSEGMLGMGSRSMVGLRVDGGHQRSTLRTGYQAMIRSALEESNE